MTSSSATRWGRSRVLIGFLPFRFCLDTLRVVLSPTLIAIVVEFAPGGTTGRIRHPGEMVGHVISGSVLWEQAGTQPRVLNAGETFIIPAGVVHKHTNRGQTAARMFATYLHDPTRALTTRVRKRRSEAFVLR